MIKKEKLIKDNVVNFPSKLTDLEKEIEAVIFAAAEPLDVDTIENKVSKKSNIDGKALMRMGAARYSCAIHGTTPDPVTGICSPPPPRQQGNVYDNSGRLIGTYVEN